MSVYEGVVTYEHERACACVRLCVRAFMRACEMMGRRYCNEEAGAALSLIDGEEAGYPSSARNLQSKVMRGRTCPRRVHTSVGVGTATHPEQSLKQ